jgi:hypothetical protein
MINRKFHKVCHAPYLCAICAHRCIGSPVIRHSSPAASSAYRIGNTLYHVVGTILDCILPGDINALYRYFCEDSQKSAMPEND